MNPEEGMDPRTAAPRTHTHFITEYLALLLRWKRFAILLFALVVAVAFVEALFLPPIYESQTRLLPVGDSSVMNNPRYQALSEFSSFVNFTAMGSSGKGALLSILDSDLMRVRVADDLDLVARYGVNEPDSVLAVHRAARRLRKILSTSINKWDNIIIRAETPDPDFTIAVLNSVIAQLYSIQNEMNLTTARRTREFIERRMAEAEQTYRQVQDTLTDFQNEHGMIAVDEQQRALVRLSAQLETELTLKRAALSASRSFFSGEYGTVRRLQAEIAALETEIARLRGSDGATAGHLSLGDLPDLAAQYVRLAMNVEIQQRLLTLLAQQYEQAKISEVREITSFEVVDPPRIPPSAKRTRKGTVMAGAVIGILAALVFPLLLDTLGRYFPDEARRDAADLLRRLVTGRKSP
jgi:uncharacterized protein involved in exopolysaccharide biosynthesis